MRAWIRPVLMGPGLIAVIASILPACGHATTPSAASTTERQQPPDSTATSRPRTLAQQTPPVTVAARAAAELALRLHFRSLGNTCSEMFGGWAPTSLGTVVWEPGTDQHPGHYERTISGIRFQADYSAEHGWEIIIYAC
jgi:hypothetical protein